MEEPEVSENTNPGPNKRLLILLFWLLFFIVIAILFYINRNTIRETVRATHFIDRLLHRPLPVEAPPGAAPVTPEGPPVYPFSQDGWEQVPPVPFPPEEAPPGENGPASEEAPLPEYPDALPTAGPGGEGPGQAPASSVAAAGSPQVPPIPPAPPERRERNLCFMQLDRDGTLVRTIVSRSLTVSPSPLTDALRALLQGPTEVELQEGLLSFIPPGTKLLDVQIRGTTAYISFSEDFQFGIFGTEGYASQVRQVVWTATEFPTVKEVQILIEGRVVSYLGESILIGNPLSRADIRF